MNDCVVVPFTSFKEQIRVQKELEKEMIKKHGLNRFKLSILDNCVMAEYKSQKIYY